MNTEALHFLTSFIKEYLGDELAEIVKIDAMYIGEIDVKYRTKGMIEGSFQTLKIRFKT